MPRRERALALARDRDRDRDRGVARAVIRVLVAALPALVAGCSVLETNWQAKRDDGTSGGVVEAQFEGNSGLSTQRLRREIDDYMIDLSREPDREAAAFDAAAEMV